MTCRAPETGTRRVGAVGLGVPVSETRVLGLPDPPPRRHVGEGSRDPAETSQTPDGPR